MFPLRPYTDYPLNTFNAFIGRTGVRQAPPYNIATPCEIHRYSSNGFTDCRSWSSSPGEWLGRNVETKSANQALARFTGALGEASQFGSTLTAERKQTFTLVTGTVIRLATAARAVKRLDFRLAARMLGIPYAERTITKVRYRKRRGMRRRYVSRSRVFTLPSGRLVQKNLANGWLMYSYGFKPAAEDIYNGLDVLQRPLAYRQRYKGSSSGSGVSRYRNDSSPYSTVFYDRTSQVRIVCGATVSVANPDLYLLNKMGLINPAQWILEGIPLSFMLDWISNLSQVVNSLGEFAGLNVDESWTSTVYRDMESVIRVTKEPRGPRYDPLIKHRIVFRRVLALPTPTLVLAYERFNWQRGLNAISLLIGVLPNGKR